MKRCTIGVALFLSLPSAAFAQAPTRALSAFVVLNGGYQATSNEFRDAAAFAANAEEGEVATVYKAKAGPTFSVGGGVRLGRHFGVSVGLSRFSVSTPGALTASIPHPFFFDQPREVTADVTSLNRDEVAVHVQVRGIAQVNERIEVTAFGGPSFFSVKQGLVSDFEYSESYPYDTAAFSGATTTSGKASKVGFNVGGDFAFFFTPTLGVGATAQVSSATVSLPLADGRTADVKAGGLQVGGGLRLRF